MASSVPEVIEITSLGDAPVITLNKTDTQQRSRTVPTIPMTKPSVNFGGGIELLMNDRRKGDGSSKDPSTDINLEDLSKLENELNGLADDVAHSASKPLSKSGLFNRALNTSGGIKLNVQELSGSTSGGTENAEDMKTSSHQETIGKATMAQGGKESTNKTWDGFTKFNSIPVNPDNHIPVQPKLTPDELLREKFKALRKLEGLERKGVTLSKKYNMESSLAEMQGEYEMIVAEKERSNSCKFQGRMLMAAVTGLEFLNNRFDPFDVKLDGWAEQLNENIDDYDDIFAELHEKYKSKAKMAPELKLLFQLGGSAIMVHMTNTMFKSAMPGMDDIMRQNPELMQQFTQAAVNSMGDTNPGFSGFMNNFMAPGGPDRPMPPANVAPGPPPAAVPTQNLRSQRAMPPSNRPDMARARADGISIEEQFGTVGPQAPERSTRESGAPPRPEMRGPSDINQLLSGLKTKNVDIQEKPIRDSSTISLQELKEISDAKTPARSKRRQKSDKNIISLDM
jgi:hypothetical protein